MSETCESCGRDDELAAVQRVYLMPDDEGELAPLGAEETEQWCASCRATYPHLAR